MYITYNTEQWQIDNLYGVVSPSTCKCQAYETQKRVQGLSKPKFMPTKLVRVSDMKVLPGSQVSKAEGYCAISYAWNQSADVNQNEITGEYSRIDLGRHKIIFPEGGRTPTRREEKSKGYILNPPANETIKIVKYEYVVQQICKDFGIKYFWYDQLCINQMDKAEILREISQVHRVYGNAWYIVALIPELQYDDKSDIFNNDTTRLKTANIDAISHSEWSKRLWILEEAFLAREILFVGRNVHMWSNVVSQYTAVGTREAPFFHTICKKPSKWTANTALFHAHTRLCTDHHDYVFILANMFAEDVLDQITFDYNQPISKLMLQFYGTLAKKDISMLCFGAYLYQHQEGSYDKNIIQSPHPSTTTANDDDDNSTFTFFQGKKGPTIQKYDIPSWTGARGRHVPIVYLKDPSLNFKSYIDGRYMQITSTSIPVSIKNEKSVDFRKEEQEQQQQNMSEHCNSSYAFIYNTTNTVSPTWSIYPHRLLSIDIPTSEQAIPFITQTTDKIASIHHTSIGEHRIKATHILPAQEKKKFWTTTTTDISSSSPLIAPHIVGGFLSLTEEDCTNCEILSTIQFEISPESGFVAMPVVTKTTDNGCYKVIGVCILDDRYKLSDPNIVRKEKLFVIS